MEWVTTILGMVTGGWGTFASLLLGLITLYFAFRKYQKYKFEKAANETKEQAVKDQQAQGKKNQNETIQSNKDLKASEELLKKLKAEQNKK